MYLFSLMCVSGKSVIFMEKSAMYFIDILILHRLCVTEPDLVGVFDIFLVKAEYKEDQGGRISTIRR